MKKLRFIACGPLGRRDPDRKKQPFDWSCFEGVIARHEKFGECIIKQVVELSDTVAFTLKVGANEDQIIRAEFTEFDGNSIKFLGESTELEEIVKLANGELRHLRFRGILDDVSKRLDKQWQEKYNDFEDSSEYNPNIYESKISNLESELKLAKRNYLLGITSIEDIQKIEYSIESLFEEYKDVKRSRKTEPECKLWN
jgi:hypothetical protein